MDRCPGHFALVQHVADELPPDKASALAKHFVRCSRCQEAIEKIRKDEAEYRTTLQPPFATLWQRLESSDTERQGKRRWNWVFALATPAVAAALLVLIWPHAAEDQSTTGPAYKGALSLQIVAKRGERQFFVSEGQGLCAGDALRFVVTTARAGLYLVVFSIDGANQLTTFYPDARNARAARNAGERKNLLLGSSGRHELPGSIVLDQTQGVETFFVLSARRPFDPAPFQRQARLLFKKSRHKPLPETAFSGRVKMVTINKGRCR
jgi:hypothetical protein